MGPPAPAPYLSKPTSPSPSSDADDDEQELTSPLSRLNLDNAPTVTSINVQGSGSRQGLRARASTTTERHRSASLTNRRRSQTNTLSQQPPPHLDLSSIANRPLLGEPLATVPETLPHQPSAPIPIPPRKRNPALFSPTGTPLTARVPPGQYFDIDNPLKPRQHISESLTPYYSGSKKMSMDQAIPSVQRGFIPMASRTGAQTYTPTSPLSPSSPNQTSFGSNRPKERRPAGNLNLSGLGKFHPANFPSKDSSQASTAHRHSRSITSQPRLGRGSDAQQKLQQYQRDHVTNTGKFAKPQSPPRLTPLKSPNEPMTPMMLEGQSDYMLAGSSAMTSSLEAGEGREYVERLVQKENERRSHPEAKSDSLSPASSPAVSPAA